MIVCYGKEFNVSDLLENTNVPPFPYYRYMIMAILKKRYKKNFPNWDLATKFGYKNHASIGIGIKSFYKKLYDSPELQKEYKIIKERYYENKT